MADGADAAAPLKSLVLHRYSPPNRINHEPQTVCPSGSHIFSERPLRLLNDQPAPYSSNLLNNKQELLIDQQEVSR